MKRFRVRLLMEESAWEVDAENEKEAMEAGYDDPLVRELSKACEKDYRIVVEEIKEEEDEA